MRLFQSMTLTNPGNSGGVSTMAATRASSRFARLSLAALSALLVLLGAAGCGSVAADRTNAPADTGAAEATGIYRATITLADEPEKWQLVEWLDPASGAWRQEEGETTKIFAGSTYAELDEWGAHIRTGSLAFLGSRPDLSLAMRPLRSYLAGQSGATGVEARQLPDGKTELRFVRGSHNLVATVEAVDEDPSVLFAIPEDQVIFDERELSVGQAPTIPVKPYWFGSKLAVGEERNVAALVQYHSVATPAMLEAGGSSPLDNADIFVLLYERASANGRTSATSTDEAPVGELQVASQAISSPSAQNSLAVFEGINGDLVFSPWPREQIRLANGESATLFIDASPNKWHEGVGFAVATASTLINVSGDVQASDISQLAPLLVPYRG
jgi:hypothetical protein